ncbi:MAG: gluconate 2-dehydrogenase subunit 3 family protein [Rugosibacter sp.]|nr:gluconate 2-dehydrogenase subunit 3 family protein [Rugosibacter sp.]
MGNRNPHPARAATTDLFAWRQTLLSRRRFLLAATGGSLAALFPLLSNDAAAKARRTDPWLLIAAVQDILFPSEPDAPGAREINALDYLRGVLAEPRRDREESRLILKGADWLDNLSRQRQRTGFLDLADDKRDQLLHEIAASEQGEHWLSTLLFYICEALLTDPVYGGNPKGIGWAWLGHTPGFPRPSVDKRHGARK